MRELAKRGIAAPPSASGAYRALLRAEMIDPSDRDRRSRKWKRDWLGAPGLGLLGYLPKRGSLLLQQKQTDFMSKNRGDGDVNVT